MSKKGRKVGLGWVEMGWVGFLDEKKTPGSKERHLSSVRTTIIRTVEIPGNEFGFARPSKKYAREKTHVVCCGLPIVMLLWPYIYE